MARPKNNRTGGDPRAAQKDSLDFRDWIYEPALIPLSESSIPDPRLVQVLDQGQAGACTGFGLASVINYLLRIRDEQATEQVSPRMLYEMAKRHDRWPGESYEGSSARGAMKGWYKNGVCPEHTWPYVVGNPGSFTVQARMQALNYPLGAFYRVLPRRPDLHAALNEVQVVYATAATHKGWTEPVNGRITCKPEWKAQGGHAFAILGYTEEGLVIQNSWGEDWGGLTLDGKELPGCAIWLYSDYDRNVWDTWVARLGRAYNSLEALSRSTGRREEYSRGSTVERKPPPSAVIRDHFLHIDDGQFDPQGDYSTSETEALDIISRAVRSNAKHIVIYAHGGLNSVKGSAKRVYKWMPVFQRNRVHEIHLIWETGLWGELRDVLLGKQDFVKSRAGGLSDWWDKWIERITGPLGRGLWSEMRSDAEIAFGDGPDRAGRSILEILLTQLNQASPSSRPKLHLVGHSAGAILLGHLLSDWDTVQSSEPNRHGFENLILFAPACTHDFFGETIKPALQNRAVKKLHQFLLDDITERRDTVAEIYRKSLLYLVSRAYQKKGNVVPIMGLAKVLKDLPTDGIKTRLKTYNTADDPGDTSSTSHGGFDNDLATMNSMLRVILGAPSTKPFEKEDLEGY